MTPQTPTEKAVIAAWLLQVMRSAGLKATPLAKEAGLAPSTLLRALDPDTPTTLERPTIAKIAARFGVPGPSLSGLPTGANPGPGGFAEPELRELDEPPAQFAGVSLTPNQFVRAVNTRALDLAGYVTGDLVLIDMSVAPRAGDVVIAQVYNLARGTAETVLRLYDRPYLVTASTDPAARTRPLLVDDEHVKIMGTVLRALRVRSG